MGNVVIDMSMSLDADPSSEGLDSGAREQLVSAGVADTTGVQLITRGSLR
jgi:hypothetical protein